jgi:hypothetical protein
VNCARSCLESTVFYTLGPRVARDGVHVGSFARAYGNNNLPDSSNMCHETTSVALSESIGVPVGTCTLDDFKHTDCISSSVRMSARPVQECCTVAGSREARRADRYFQSAPRARIGRICQSPITGQMLITPPTRITSHITNSRPAATQPPSWASPRFFSILRKRPRRPAKGRSSIVTLFGSKPRPRSTRLGLSHASRGTDRVVEEVATHDLIDGMDK